MAGILSRYNYPARSASSAFLCSPKEVEDQDTGELAIVRQSSNLLGSTKHGRRLSARTIAPKSSGSGPGREPQVTHYEHVRNFGEPQDRIFRFVCYSLGIPREPCFERGSTGPEALTQAIRLRGIMTRMETRRDAQRTPGMAQCLPAASTNTLPRDRGATTRRFPAAPAA